MYHVDKRSPTTHKCTHTYSPPPPSAQTLKYPHLSQNSEFDWHTLNCLKSINSFIICMYADAHVYIYMSIHFFFLFGQVDVNVTRHLKKELAADDWDAMILHYLGLDHIGHVYGPSSNLVPPKLLEMDDVVRQIYSAMSSWVCGWKFLYFLFSFSCSFSLILFLLIFFSVYEGTCLR